MQFFFVFMEQRYFHDYSEAAEIRKPLVVITLLLVVIEQLLVVFSIFNSKT
jgi:hypothetical protein